MERGCSDGGPVACWRVRTKAFCVGQAKAGTATLWGLLGTEHRAAHEPERAETLRLILAEARGSLTVNEVRGCLAERDRRLDLDYDIAWANQFIVGYLVEMLPDARFVLLVRDPHSWLQSVVGHMLVRQVPQDVKDFFDFWFKPDRYPKTTQDGDLPYSIMALLTAWSNHIELCTTAIPTDRLLTIRTQDLGSSHQRLAEFLEIQPDSLDRARAHLNQGEWSGRFDSLVDPSYIARIIDAVCATNVNLHQLASS